MPCEHYAVQSLVRMLDMVRLTRRKTNPWLSYRVLVTMYDMRNRIHPMILRYLRDRFPDALFETIIQVDTKLRESPAFAKPITEHAPQTRAARQYQALAEELIHYLRLGARDAAEAMAAGRAGAATDPQRTAEQDDGGSALVPGRDLSEDQGRIRQVVPGGNGR
jgi:hypothetical protein